MCSVKTPGGKLSVQYLKKKGTAPKCGDCGGVIQGVSVFVLLHDLVFCCVFFFFTIFFKNPFFIIHWYGPNFREYKVVCRVCVFQVANVRPNQLSRLSKRRKTVTRACTCLFFFLFFSFILNSLISCSLSVAAALLLHDWYRNDFPTNIADGGSRCATCV